MSVAAPVPAAAASAATEVDEDDDILDFVFNPGLQAPTLRGGLPEADPKLAIVLDPKLVHELKVLQRQAIELAENEKLESAIEVFTACITRCPQYAAAYNDRAMTYQLLHAKQQKQQTPTAAAATTTAATPTPATNTATAATAVVAASAVASAVDYSALALSDLDAAIRLGCGNPTLLKQAYTQRGVLRKLLQLTDPAIADFEKAAKLGSEFARTEAVRLNPYAAMCNAMLAEAVQKLSDDKKSKPNGNANTNTATCSAAKS